MYKMCKKATCFISCLLLTSCTFNVSMAHTQGTATDTIDDTASNTPDISPTITIPVSPTGL
jgi:hypothetical protein